MHRRHFLAGTGLALTTTLAGCGMLDSEEYEEGNEEDLLPDEPSDEWDDELTGDHDLNENYRRVWVNDDETVIILMDAKIEETIEDAEDQFERSKNTARDPNDFELADEAFLADDGESAQFTFRHSNALGVVVALRESGFEVVPDRQRARNYGEWLWDYWQE